MHDQVLTFRQLLAPVTPEAFFTEFFGRKPLHVRAPAARYEDLFSWAGINDLLRMTTVWSAKTLDMAMNGSRLPTEAYCYEGTTRENEKGWRPDFQRVRQHLKKGASMTLNHVGRLTPELRSLSQTFESVFGSPVNIFAFCSWQGVGAYPSHFDSGSVFVCQISGSKTWNLYEGRMPNAAHTAGYSGGEMSPEFNERSKGEVSQRIDLQAGDLLYVPHGQYHDAVASSNASLHLSIAVRHMVGHDFINLLAADLPKDPLFREHLPHIDMMAAADDYRQRLSRRLNEIMENPQVGRELRQFLHAKAFEGIAEFNLPHLEGERFYRVRWMHFRLDDGGKELLGPNLRAPLGAAEAAWAEWILARDYFSSLTLAENCAPEEHGRLASWLHEMEKTGLIEVMA